MAHVLIGYAEALPAPEVVFSLLNAGHKVSAFARSADLPLRHLPLEALHVVPTPEQDADAACRALAELMQGDSAPDLLLPLDDGGLWLSAHSDQVPARIAGATGEQVRAALDKSIQIEAAKSAGLPVPETIVLRSEADCRAATFPSSGIAKPALAIDRRDGKVGKGGVLYLNANSSADELVSMIDASGPLLVQPLIAGTGEGVFGFATDQGVVGWSGHRRVRMLNPHGSGSSACRRVQPDADLKDQVSAFLKHLNWRGAFMVELLRDADGTPWFMELNGRMWGSLALARRQGFEYPAWAVEQRQNPGFMPNAPAAPRDPGVVRNLGRDLLHLAFVLRGPKSEFYRDGWPSFWRSAAGVFRPAPGRRFYNYDPAHRSYLWRDAIWTVKRGLKR